MIIPPLKIQGKKTRIVPSIMEVAGACFKAGKPHVWVEPFMGSGAVAFNTPDFIGKVIANDINPHIVRFYKSVQSGDITPESVEEDFRVRSAYLMRNGKDYYDEVKGRFNASGEPMDFLFLTRTGFNGLMRFNSRGEWNVPYCRLDDRISGSVISDLTGSVRNLSALFRRKEYEFTNSDYKEVLERTDIDFGDAVTYCDPPYFGLSVQYFSGWKEEDEENLHRYLKDRTFIYSTWISDGKKRNPMIEKLWSGYRIEEVSHKYSIAGHASERSRVTEGLIYNRDVSPFMPLF